MGILFLYRMGYEGPLHKGWDLGIEDFRKMPRLAGHSIKKHNGMESHQECEHRKASMWIAATVIS